MKKLRLVLVGAVGAGKSKVARNLLGVKEPKSEAGLCILYKGESSGRKICLVDTPGWDQRSIHRTPENIKSEIERSVTLCPPGPHAVIVVLRVDSSGNLPSTNELKSVSQHTELLSQRVWKHTMVLFLCDGDVEEAVINEHIQKAKKLLEKCGSRHYVLRSQIQVPEFLMKVEEMVDENCGDFFLPQVYYDYMQSQIPKDILEVKKMYEVKEEELRMNYLRKLNEYKSQAEEAGIRKRRGSLSKDRPSMSEDEQPVDIVAIKSKYRDEMLALARYYLKPVAVLLLAVIGALIGSVVGSAYGVMGSGGGIVIGVAVTIPLALWLIGAASLARNSSDFLQERKYNT